MSHAIDLDDSLNVQHLPLVRTNDYDALLFKYKTKLTIDNSSDYKKFKYFIGDLFKAETIRAGVKGAILYKNESYLKN